MSSRNDYSSSYLNRRLLHNLWIFPPTWNPWDSVWLFVCYIILWFADIALFGLTCEADVKPLLTPSRCIGAMMWNALLLVVIQPRHGANMTSCIVNGRVIVRVLNLPHDSSVLWWFAHRVGVASSSPTSLYHGCSDILGCHGVWPPMGHPIKSHFISMCHYTTGFIG